MFTDFGGASVIIDITNWIVAKLTEKCKVHDTTVKNIFNVFCMHQHVLVVKF